MRNERPRAASFDRLRMLVLSFAFALLRLGFRTFRMLRYQALARCRNRIQTNQSPSFAAALQALQDIRTTIATLTVASANDFVTQIITYPPSGSSVVSHYLHRYPSSATTRDKETNVYESNFRAKTRRQAKKLGSDAPAAALRSATEAYGSIWKPFPFAFSRLRLIILTFRAENGNVE